MKCIVVLLILLQVVQKEREEKLASILKDRLNQYVQGNKEGFISHAEAEVSRLSNAGYIPIILYLLLFLPLNEDAQLYMLYLAHSMFNNLDCHLLLLFQWKSQYILDPLHS